MVTIQNWLQDLVNVTDEELDVINEITETTQVKANEVILKQGQVSTRIGLLAQGAVRTYFTDTQGNDKVVSFAFEGQLLLLVDSFFNQPKNLPNTI